MEARPHDTTADADAHQVELLRRMTPAERLSRMRRHSAWACWLSRQGIARANPDLDPAELRLRFIEVQYGAELADAVRRDREARHDGRVRSGADAHPDRDHAGVA